MEFKIITDLLQISSAVLAFLYFFRDSFFYFYKLWIEKRLTYNSIYKAHLDLLSKIDEDFDFETIFIVNIHGFLIPNFIYEKIKHKTYFHIYCFTKERKTELMAIYPNMEILETGKWLIFLPKINETIIKKKILILDDFCITGNSLCQIKKYFEKNNIKKIKTASLFVSDVCIKNGNCPDYFVSQKSINLKTPFDKIR